MAPRRIHFVTVTHPDQASLTKAQKAANAHAAREAHARTRRQRVKEYQARSTIAERPRSEDRDDSLVPVRQDVGDGAALGGVSWTPTVLDSTGSGYANPFYATERPLTQQDHFLFNHYITCIIPRLADLCPKLDMYEGMLPVWLNLVLTNAQLLHCALLTASRHLQVYHWLESFSHGAHRTAARYKLVCLEELSRAIRVEAATRTFGVATIAKTFVMGLDEMSFGEVKRGHGYFGHVIKMVEASGGAASLEGNIFVHHMYQRLIQGQLLDDYLYEPY